MGETFYSFWWCFSKNQSNFIYSTATQTIQFLNDLYNKFDKAIDNYDVYKVKWNICIIFVRPWNRKREFSLKGRDSRRWLPGCKWLALSKWKTGTRDQDWRIFCLFILVIDNPFYLDISARKRDFKHGHSADAGGQRVQGLIFQDKISKISKSKSVFKSKIFPKVSHVRNYKMQMRMGIHSGWRHLLVIA